MLVLAVLVILITAPIGAVAIYLAGPRLLKHTPRVYSIEVDEPAEEKNGKKVEDGEEGPDSKKLLALNDTDVWPFSSHKLYRRDRKRSAENGFRFIVFATGLPV